jgi:KamA family protein
MHDTTTQGRRFRVYQRRDLDRIPELAGASAEERLVMKAVSAVLPFRVNPYVVEELIDWNRAPSDPMYQLTFPQRGMLEPLDLARMMDLVREDAPAAQVEAAAREVQMRLNPHPAGQMALNVPLRRGAPVQGIQHKYRETVLFFPAQGQTCHAYCSYCFRWPQFVGLDELKFASAEAEGLVDYLREHPEVTSVLITGGDPLVMKTQVLRRYIEPLLTSGLDHIESIRIGTKAPAYWPFRFTTDPDADDLLRLFGEVRASGRTMAIMAHYSHPRELEPAPAREALARIQSSGAVVRCQAPLIRHVNDDPSVWAELWNTEVRLGAVPYYFFVARDTGARRYFEVPLSQALRIFGDAYRMVSGLARTVRGPSMSATPGKVCIEGTTRIAGEKVFVLKLLQARDPSWVGQPFFATYDRAASWLDQLRPAFGDERFFYEHQLADLASRSSSWEEDLPAAALN